MHAAKAAMEPRKLCTDVDTTHELSVAPQNSKGGINSMQHCHYAECNSIMPLNLQQHAQQEQAAEMMSSLDQSISISQHGVAMRNANMHKSIAWQLALLHTTQHLFVAAMRSLGQCG